MSQRNKYNFYVELSNTLFARENFESIELHASGEKRLTSLIKTVDILTHYNYATVSNIQTATFSRKTGLSKAYELIVVLKRGIDFDRLF